MASREQSSIETKNLVLRPLKLSDAPRVQRLAGDIRIAETTENIPHPYRDGMAERWIKTLAPAWENKTAATFAISPREHAELIGCCGLQISVKHRKASLGYWIGVDFWNQGHCTEAASALIAFGFEQLSLHRIEAQHLSKNPASGAVMRKLGMQHEATLIDYVLKGDHFEDVELYAKFS